MKKIILLSILILSCAYLSAMSVTFTKEEQDMFEAALNDDAKVKDFTDYVAFNFIDIDSVLEYSGGQTIGKKLAMQLELAKGVWGTPSHEAKNRIENLINPAVQWYRSFPPEFGELLVRIIEALNDDNKLADLKAYLKDKSFNLDLIAPVNNKYYSLAHRLESYSSTAGSARDRRAQAILALDEIKKFRTNKEATALPLFKAFEKDPKSLRYIKVWFKKFPVDVDSMLYDTFTTIGKVIDDLVSKAAAKDAVHEIAWLVRPYRAAKMREFRTLLNDYESDTAKFEPLKKWFKENPFDVDGVANHPGDPKGPSIGSYINTLKAEIKGPVGELVRPYRAAEVAAFRDLLVDYEINYIKKDQLQKLKEWFVEHPFDIDAVAYDPTQPDGETFGDKINTLMLEDSSLGALFNAKRSKPAPLAKPSWISGRKILIAAATIATISLYLWHQHKSTKDMQKDEEVRTSVA